MKVHFTLKLCTHWVCKRYYQIGNKGVIWWTNIGFSNQSRTQKMLTNSFTTSTAKIEKNEDIYVLHTCYSTTLAWYEECIICLIDTFEKKENQKTIRSNWRHSTCTLNALGLDCGYNWLFSDSRDIAWPLPLRSTVRQKSLRLPRQPAFRPNRQVKIYKKGKAIKIRG